LKPRRTSSSSDAQWLSRAGRPSGEQEIGVVIQAARSRDLRLEHAQRSGRGVARIGEAREAFFVAIQIQTLEGAPVHDDFAAHFEIVQAVSTLNGSERMVRAFSVTSSPTLPSPRVTACVNRPAR
jgi:hypothetical protein